MAVRTNRDLQRLRTRDRVYEAAISEFKRVGYRAAQIDRIVHAAGVAHGTFFMHFPSKEHVLFELRRRTEARTVERLQRSPRTRL